MSGNRLLILVLLFLSLSSCKLLGITAKAEEKEDVKEKKTEAPVKKTDESPKPDVKKEETRKVKRDEVVFHGEVFKVPKFENDFKAALILPFHLFDDKNANPVIRNIMLDYYEGVLLALDELKAKGLNLKLFVYDNQNDSMELKKILAKSEMSSMNLIVGPISREQLNIVSRFSVDHNIPLVSPLTYYSNLNQKNLLYYNCTPEESTRGKMLARFVDRVYPDSRVLIVRDGKEMDREITPAFIKEFDTLSQQPIKKVAYAKGNNYASMIEPGKSTVVFIPSTDAAVVGVTLNALKDIDNVKVFGLEAWKEFKNNDYRVWERLKVHLISRSFIDFDDPAVRDVRAKYRARFKGEPSEYFYRGYDHFLFFGEALFAFGPNFPTFITKTSFRYIHNNFHFISNGRCFENNSVNFLLFENYKLQKLQK